MASTLPAQAAHMMAAHTLSDRRAAIRCAASDLSSSESWDGAHIGDGTRRPSEECHPPSSLHVCVVPTDRHAAQLRVVVPTYSGWLNVCV
jgi:hypothetical protein